MNKFDDVRLDIGALLAEQDQRPAVYDPAARSGDGLGRTGRLKSRARLGLTNQLVRRGWWRRLIYTSLKLDWFDEFRAYWVGVLGNRPLAGPHEFYYLYDLYRQRFQNVTVPDDATGHDHLAAWHDARTVYLLFSYQFKLALNPLAARPYVGFIPVGGKVCEYGCGFAPIATSLTRHYAHRDLSITCADIPALMFHFTRWKFRDARHVRMVPIDPDVDTPLDETYDAIFCMTVFEHLPRPLAVAQHFYDHLKPGGMLIFDYILSEGAGLDTASARDQRSAVLDYIAAHFEPVRGQIDPTGQRSETVICRRR